jgi:hypothetical protein
MGEVRALIAAGSGANETRRTARADFERFRPGRAWQEAAARQASR